MPDTTRRKYADEVFVGTALPSCLPCCCNLFQHHAGMALWVQSQYRYSNHAKPPQIFIDCMHSASMQE